MAASYLFIVLTQAAPRGRSNTAEVTADRSRVNATCSTDLASGGANRAAAAATAATVASGHTAAQAALGLEKARVQTSRDASKTAANANIAGTATRFTARSNAVVVETTRVHTQLRASKAAHGAHIRSPPGSDYRALGERAVLGVHAVRTF